MLKTFLDECRPIIKYIKGTDNYAGDALIRILLIKSDVTEGKITRENLGDIYCVDKLDDNTFPLTYQMIEKHQRKKNNW